MVDRPGFLCEVWWRPPGSEAAQIELQDRLNLWHRQGYNLLSIVPMGERGDMMLIYRDKEDEPVER